MVITKTQIPMLMVNYCEKKIKNKVQKNFNLENMSNISDSGINDDNNSIIHSFQALNILAEV